MRVRLNNLDVLQAKILLNSVGNHYRSCLVGGCVRDMLMGKEPKDFDFATNIDLDTLAKLFRNAGWKVDEKGLQFLVMIVSKNGTQFEIANFRKDGTYKDGRRPESVDIGTIEDDAARRDFTINALYIDLEKETLVDPTGMGLKDLKSQTLRFVGKPVDRINEDALRIMRFYRFLAQHPTLNADKKSLRACREHFFKVSDLAAERVRIEVEKMAKTC